MFGSLGSTELIVIVVLVLIVFGAGKLPSVMKDLGKGVSEFKKAQQTDGEPVVSAQVRLLRSHRFRLKRQWLSPLLSRRNRLRHGRWTPRPAPEPPCPIHSPRTEMEFGHRTVSVAIFWFRVAV